MSHFDLPPEVAPEGVPSPARRHLLALGAALGGAAFAGALFQPAHADLVASLGKVIYLDPIVLNFAFELEELEADFFARALSAGGADKITGRQRNALSLIAAQDQEHFEQLGRIRDKLGYKPARHFESSNTEASRRPRVFHYGDLGSGQELLATALDLKETALFAYHGAAGLINDASLLAAAVAIAGIEGRHAAVLRESMGLDPVPAPFEGALTAQVSGRKLSKYGFQGGGVL